MNNDIFFNIKNKIAYLNPALRRIAEFIIQNQEKCKTITIKELALSCKVAESTVTRFVKEMGLKNFQELKIELTESISIHEHSEFLPITEPTIYEDISKTDTTSDIIEKIFYKNVQKMTACKELLHVPSLNKAVALIEKSKRIVFVCTGSSAVAAEEAVMRFTRAGKYCVFWRDYSLQLMTSSILNTDDVIIGISDSGKTKSVVDAMNVAKENGAKLIAITSNFDTKLANACDVVLLSPERLSKTQSALHWESTSSKAAQILIIDILYACFAVQNYDKTLLNLDKTYKAIKQTREE